MVAQMTQPFHPLPFSPPNWYFSREFPRVSFPRHNCCFFRERAAPPPPPSPPPPPQVLQASKALKELVNRCNADDGLSKCVISDICKTFNLNTHDVLIYKKSA
ncbi:hypothetical protein Droror1_Dr00027236 [Drosera rotundifolia]